MAYVYILKHVNSGKYYIGSRYAKSAKPSDLLNTYFTSSETIKSIIETDGVNSITIFKIENCKRDEALDLESRTIKDWASRYGEESLLNKAYHTGGRLMFLGLNSNESREANSRKQKEIWATKSEESKEFLKRMVVEALKGKPKSKEHALKISAGQKKRNSQLDVWNTNKAKKTRHIWAFAAEFYRMSKFNPENKNKEKPYSPKSTNGWWGHERACSQLNGNKNVRIFWKMHEMFKEGWVPLQDKNWMRDFG